MALSFSAKETQILHGTDMPQQKQLIISKLETWQGTNIEDFHWQCLAAMKTNKTKESKALKVYKRSKDDIEEKKEKQTGNEGKSVSVLIDFELGRSKGGLCPKGDWYFDNANVAKDKQCTECGSTENVMYCDDCRSRDGIYYYACAECRLKNLQRLEYESKMDEIKRRVIRRELLSKPTLSLDILCGLPRKSGLDKLMNDIMGLEATDRQDYLILLLDVDNLKALNSALTHQGADKVIQQIGFVLKRWCQKVNDGQFKNDCYLIQAFPYRFVYICRLECKYTNTYYTHTDREEMSLLWC